MIALSGYNVSIVATSISDVFGRFFTPIIASVAGCIGIVLFVIMTGASSTAIRAACMALLVIYSRASGRPVTTFRVLAIAALLLVAYDPSYLTSDVSFQLSFLAFLGLVLIAPTYTHWFSKYLPPMIARMFAETCAAETAVIPFIIYKMGLFSTVSLPVNSIILPFIPYLMFGGFVLICVAYVLNTVTGVIGYPVYLLAHAIIFVIEKAAQFPFAAVSVSQIPLALIVSWYMIFIAFFSYRMISQKE
jgi:competence protein ComEC